MGALTDIIKMRLSLTKSAISYLEAYEDNDGDNKERLKEIINLFGSLPDDLRQMAELIEAVVPIGKGKTEADKLREQICQLQEQMIACKDVVALIVERLGQVGIVDNKMVENI